MAWEELEDPPKGDLQSLHRDIGGRVQFLVDENLGEGSAETVRYLGYKATWAGDVRLTGKADKTLFAYAWRRGLFLLSHDHDFLNDRQFPFSRNPGVIVLPGANGNERMLTRALYDVCNVVGDWKKLWVRSKIEIYEDQTWRVRRFRKNLGRHTTDIYKWDRTGRTYQQKL